MTGQPRAAGAALVVALAVVLPPPARTAEPVLLRSPAQRIEWTGTFAEAGGCPDQCHKTPLEVALPPDVWASGGGVQVGVHWSDPSYDLNVFVYSGEDVVAFSAEWTGDTDSVLVPALPNGSYTVAITALAVDHTDYTAWVEVERPRPGNPRRDLLPALVPLPPTDVGVREVSLVGGTCHEDEVVEAGARRCLRFDTVVANLGEGPLDLRFEPSVPGALAGSPVRQRVHRADGTSYERPAGTWDYHATHSHFHVSAFAQARLWQSDAAGQRLGGAPVRTGRKNGFCLLDLYNLRWTERGDGARTFNACQYAAALRDPAHTAATGLSAGWADEYVATLPGQYVEVSGLPEGWYVLDLVVDPDRVLLLAGEPPASEPALLWLPAAP